LLGGMGGLGLGLGGAPGLSLTAPGLGGNLGLMGLGFGLPAPNALLPSPSPSLLPLVPPQVIPTQANPTQVIPAQVNPAQMTQAIPTPVPITTGAVQPNMVAISNVVFDVTAEQLRGVFEAFGKIAKCEMKTNPATGKHNGTGFIEFLDEKSVKDCIAMNGFDLCGQKLKLSPVHGASPFSEIKAESRVVGLRNMVSASEVDSELEDEIREECESFAQDKTKPCVEKVVVHIHPSKNVTIFVLFIDKDVSKKAKLTMHGRWFGGKQVLTDFFPEDKFNANQFD